MQSARSSEKKFTLEISANFFKKEILEKNKFPQFSTEIMDGVQNLWPESRFFRRKNPSQHINSRKFKK